MKIVEKKFQLINVGMEFWSKEYHEKLLANGYELIGENENGKKYVLKGEDNAKQRT